MTHHSISVIYHQGELAIVVARVNNVTHCISQVAIHASDACMLAWPYADYMAAMLRRAMAAGVIRLGDACDPIRALEYAWEMTSMYLNNIGDHVHVTSIKNGCIAVSVGQPNE